MRCWFVLVCCHTAAIAQPVITRVTPAFGQPGDVVTVTGTGFQPAAGAVNARFGPNRAPVVSASPSEVKVQVPNGQPLGGTRLSIDGSNGLSFNTILQSKIPTPPSPT
jgi:hypothetical protein